MANEEKRRDRAAMSSPDTAVRRVDLRRQRETETRDMSSDTKLESGDSQSVIVNRE